MAETSKRSKVGCDAASAAAAWPAKPAIASIAHAIKPSRQITRIIGVAPLARTHSQQVNRDAAASPVCRGGRRASRRQIGRQIVKNECRLLLGDPHSVTANHVFDLGIPTRPGASSGAV